MTRLYYEITTADVRQPTIRAFGRTWMVQGLLGRVLPGDVGKRVYLVSRDGDHSPLQVENDEQRARRLR